MRTDGAHPTQSVPPPEKETYVSNLAQSEQTVQDDGQRGSEDSERQRVEELQEVPTDVGHRFMSKVRELEDSLDFENVERKYRWLAPAIAYMLYLGPLSEAELAEAINYATNLKPGSVEKNRVAACAVVIRNKMSRKPHDQLAKIKCLNDRGKFEWPEFPTLKAACKRMGVQWQTDWDQNERPKSRRKS